MKPKTENMCQAILNAVKNIIIFTIGSLIFAAILEGYKSDLNSEKNIVIEFYRPFENEFANYSKTLDDLIELYDELYKTSLLLKIQSSKVSPKPTEEDLNKSAQDYSKISDKVKMKETEASRLESKFYQHAEELALKVGLYNDFRDIQKIRRKDLKKVDSILNKINRKLSDDIGIKTARDFVEAKIRIKGGHSSITRKQLNSTATKFNLAVKKRWIGVLNIEKKNHEKIKKMFTERINSFHDTGIIRSVLNFIY